MTSRGRLAAGIVGCLTLFAIGWTGLLIPSLVRSIETTFDQTDAGVGLIYLSYSVAYATGSFGGGPLTERVGRRLVLGGGVLIHGLGIAGLGLAPSWGAFVAAAMVAALGAGCLDGGSNGLVLDVYREGRGRAMNLLHVSFSVGALAAPLIVGRLVDGGVPWQTVAMGVGALVLLLLFAYAFVPMPSGRRGATDLAGQVAASPGPPGRLRDAATRRSGARARSLGQTPPVPDTSPVDHLETERIALDSAEQRAGRAGRTAPGRATRLCA